MQFKSWLLFEEDNIVVGQDGSVIIHEPDAVPMSVWSKIYNFLRRKGYDLRSAEDTKTRLSRWSQYSGDHAEAIKKALATRAPRTAEQKLVTKAKRFFGTTTNFHLAGYILPDGSLLDFSGARQGNSFPTQREQDHREIGKVMQGPGGTEGMVAFCRQTGSIRVGFVKVGQAYINIYKEPNRKQFETLFRGLAGSEDAYLDVSDGQRRFSDEYTKPQFKKLLMDVEAFYRGESPTQTTLTQRFYT